MKHWYMQSIVAEASVLYTSYAQTSYSDNPRIVHVSINPLRVINCRCYSIYSSGRDTVNVPKPLSSLTWCVPRPSDIINYVRKLATQARARVRSRASC